MAKTDLIGLLRKVKRTGFHFYLEHYKGGLVEMFLIYRRC